MRSILTCAIVLALLLACCFTARAEEDRDNWRFIVSASDANYSASDANKMVVITQASGTGHIRVTYSFVR